MAVAAVGPAIQAVNSEISSPADPPPTLETALQATFEATLIATLGTALEEPREKIREAIREAARKKTSDTPAQVARKAAEESSTAAAQAPAAPSGQDAPAVADDSEARYLNSSLALYSLVLCGLVRGGLVAPKLPHREFPRTLSTGAHSTSPPPSLALFESPRRSEAGGWTRSNR